MVRYIIEFVFSYSIRISKNKYTILLKKILMAFKFRKKNDDKKMLFPPLYVAFEIM